MSSERLRRVCLSGDLSGDYVVVEERSDGSLVVAPEAPAGAPVRPMADDGGTVFSKLFARSRPDRPASAPELLARWGVQLREDEVISEFLTASVDGRPGFLALTSQRLIFVEHAARGSRAAEEHLLFAARNVELVRRGVNHRLRVTWHGSESVISDLSRESLARLREHLAPAVNDL
jgi:hypothetical protein